MTQKNKYQKYRNKMTDDQKDFFAKAGKLEIKYLFPSRRQLEHGLIRDNEKMGILDPLPNADWAIRKQS